MKIEYVDLFSYIKKRDDPKNETQKYNMGIIIKSYVITN